MSPHTTKISSVQRLISRQTGATTEQLQKATGWQSHSVRAAISGLRKVGHTIERTANSKGASVYRYVKEA